MSSPAKEDVTYPEESQEPEADDFPALATPSMLDTDIFNEIDKRLGLLLDRANKLESTLNQLNGKCHTDDQDLELDLIEEEGDEHRFDDVMDVNGTDNLVADSSDKSVPLDALAENLDNIYLDIQED